MITELGGYEFSRKCTRLTNPNETFKIWIRIHTDPLRVHERITHTQMNPSDILSRVLPPMLPVCEPCGVASDGDRDKPGAEAFYFSRGPGTFRVPRGLPTAARAKLVAAMCAAGHADGVILLRGGAEVYRYDSDHEPVFRQESYFAHLFGVKEPDCWAMIELPSGRSTLFIPKLAPEYAIWMGEIKAPSWFEQHYGVDAVLFVNELQAAVGGAVGSATPIYVLSGTNSDSGLDLATVLPITEGVPAGAIVDSRSLYTVAAECRVRKSTEEVEVMRYAAWVSSCAHASVMREARAGMLEYQLEALFLFHCAFHGGCRHQAYTCICACGPDGAVLHYGHAGAPNERQLLETDMALLDMGCEYQFYASDITCSFPLSGEFSADQRVVYEAVLDSQRQILSAMRPGVLWSDMHRLMWRVTLTHLSKAGLVRGDLEAMLEANVGYIFTPHGLGHLIGIDTHDVGGYLPHTPKRSDINGLKRLRTARVLEAGMVLTVEPGCYFIDALLEPALAEGSPYRQYLVPEVIARFRGFGGVRLEDVVLVTVTGVDNLTLCPRTVSEVEAVRRGAEWPPSADAAPWLHRRWHTLDKKTGRMVVDMRVRVETEPTFTTETDF